MEPNEPNHDEQMHRLRQKIIDIQRDAILAMERGATVEEKTYRAMALVAWGGVSALETQEGDDAAQP
jgi:hypothetical protein